MTDTDLVVDALRELVDALDRRVAPADRLGEAGVAVAALSLRTEAVARIDAHRAASLDRDTREGERSRAVMSDDGGPLRARE
jgi:hypothetical protein